MTPVALTIAGSDPSGGAGIQADLKTFHRFGVYGEAAITLLTVQNTVKVERVELMPPGLVADQIGAVLADIPPGAIKTGALGSRSIIESVAASLSGACPATPLVVDPVMISKHGAPLIAAEAAQALIRSLFPLAALVTPNLHESAALSGRQVNVPVEMEDAGRALLDLGAAAVLVKGGHLAGDAADVLIRPGQPPFWVRAPRTATAHTHGTGCTYSAALTALLSRGHTLEEAVREAKGFISRAIATNPGLGAGNGPVNHFA